MVELNESLTKLIRTEPKSEASRQARKMGLKYMGFGRYADHTGNVAYVVVKDKLVPFKKSEELSKMFQKAADSEAKKMKEPPPKPGEKAKPKKNTDPTFSDVRKLDGYRSERQKEDKKALESKSKEVAELDKELSSFYAGAFSDDEMDAIQEYTGSTFEDINSYLYNGHPEGIDYQSAKWLEGLVDKLDSAFEETEAPFKYTTYTGLSQRYNPESFEIGREYIFKGYVSSSLDHSVAGGVFTDYKEDKKSKSKAGVMLELDIPKGAKSIYIPNHMNASDNEYETLLPRGTKIKVVSGPHRVHSSAVIDKAYANGFENPGENDNDLVIFKCKIVKDE